MPLVTFALWFALVWGAGWFFFPVARRLFAGVLPDAGLAAGRILFLVIWTLVAFWAGYAGLALRFSALFWMVLALFGLLIWKRDALSMKAEIRIRKRAIWASEAIFLTVFLSFFAVRGFWSDVNGNNGEKSMDSALIGSLVRAEKLPPSNPYAAGARLNSYYYFGHLQSALLTDAIDSHPRWTYNLMCATLPALCFSTLFSLGAALTKRIKGGIFCCVSVLGLGTLQPIYQWLRPQEFGADTIFRLQFFAVSRVIPYSINEFPFFTFNQADLHAHYFALPLALATISLSYSIFCGNKVAIWPATALLAAQILTNTWDFPAYALIVGLAIWGGAHAKNQQVEKTSELEKQKPNSISRLFCSPWARLIFVFGGALLLAAPYLLHLKTAASPPKWLTFPVSPLREWLLLWGVFAAAWLAFLSYSISDSRRYHAFFLGLGAIFGFYALAIPWQKPDPFVLPLIAILLGLSLWGARQLRNEARFLCLLAVAGLCALMWSETTWAGFLGDAKNLGFDDFKRQDTVFKFGLQTWILWGIATSCGAFLTHKKWPSVLKLAFAPALSVMAIASVAVIFGRARNFEKWDGWDAWAHLAPSEKMAAQWLVTHVKPGENLLEAERQEGGDYSPYARYASATGIPTVVGPQAHTFQWSPANSGDAGREWAEVFRRKTLARAIYTVGSAVQRSDWLRSFGVKTIVFGELERQEYGIDALKNLKEDPNLVEVARFDASTNDIDASHRVQIFRVK
ncbi:putative membrane protein [Abditibacterium utsteinense]|uniref:Putative membrane protein n=1 Tax=Abditibacterium utsteinense TaxID=1960156 RepID=A0A2S8SUF3_9BACT|nr:DUF2298 domain-containing protein [Abditibacterium utsteinense]PQV64425.1 putative membrane protein [Abditibacterium utsteinense]